MLSHRTYFQRVQPACGPWGGGGRVAQLCAHGQLFGRHAGRVCKCWVFYHSGCCCLLSPGTDAPSGTPLVGSVLGGSSLTTAQPARSEALQSWSSVRMLPSSHTSPRTTTASLPEAARYSCDLIREKRISQPERERERLLAFRVPVPRLWVSPGGLTSRVTRLRRLLEFFTKVCIRVNPELRQ